MSRESAISVLGIELTAKQSLVLLAIGVACLHPFVFATVSPAPFFLGLPWWYFANVGVLAVIYLLIQLYVSLDGAGQESTEALGGER